MAVNQQSRVRQPRAKVTANGTTLRWEKIEIVKTADHTSDMFMVELPLFDPKAPFDWVWWSQTAPIEIEIQVGFMVNGSLGRLTSLVTGPAERIEMLPLPAASRASRSRGAMLAISGTDYARPLINSPYSSEYVDQNLRPSEIINDIISHHPELTVDMSAVSDSVGEPYNNLQGRLVLHRSEWDVLTALADHEHWRVRVEGKKLILEPAADKATSGGYQLFYQRDKTGKVQSNCLSLRLSRNLDIAGGVKVKVQAYDTATGEPPVQAEATAQSGSADSDAPTMTYTANIGGLTQDQANQHTEAWAQQLAQFERQIEALLPGDPTITVDGGITLSGTGTAFDQFYPVARLTHLITMQRGYLTEIVAQAPSNDSMMTATSAAGQGTEHNE